MIPEYKIAVISTGHITAHDNDLLSTEGCPMVLATDEHSFWLHLPEAGSDNYSENLDARIKELLDFGLSGSLEDIIRTCADQGIRYLRIDSLGDLLEDFPTFDW